MYAVYMIWYIIWLCTGYNTLYNHHNILYNLPGSWLGPLGTFDTLRLGQRGCHFADDIFRFILLDESYGKISFKFVLKDPNGCQMPDGTNIHYLEQCWHLISEVLWHSPESNFTWSAQVTRDFYLPKFQDIVQTFPNFRTISVYID